MNYKETLIKVWRTNPLGIVTAVYNILVLFVNSVVRWGRLYSLVIKRNPGDFDLTRTQMVSEYSKPVLYSELVYEVEEDPSLIFPDLIDPILIRTDHVVSVVGMEDDVCQIIIRGTDNEANWVQGLNPDGEWSESLKSIVHDGYLDIAAHISSRVLKYLDGRLTKVKIQGHSMGGGVSVILASILNEVKTIDLVAVYSIAGPKVIQADYDDLPVTHIMHVQDPIPYLPVWTFITPYRHQGLRLLIEPDGTMGLFKDSVNTDLHNSIWLLMHQLDIEAHSNYSRYFKERRSVDKQ